MKAHPTIETDKRQVVVPIYGTISHILYVSFFLVFVPGD